MGRWYINFYYILAYFLVVLLIIVFYDFYCVNWGGFDILGSIDFRWGEEPKIEMIKENWIKINEMKNNIHILQE